VSDRAARQSTPANDKTAWVHQDHGVAEGATPGQTGALDGAAAAGSLGAVSGSDGAIPEHTPDPTFGPD